MTKLILKNPGTNKNNQRKNKHTGSKHTHTNTGPRGKTEHSQLAFPTLSFQKNTIPRNGSPQNSHPAFVKTSQMDLQGISCALRWHWWHDTKVSCQKTKHTPVDERKETPWPLAPGPWPSIPVSLLPTKCSEQAAAGSRRQQQQTAGSSRKQQKNSTKE